MIPSAQYRIMQYNILHEGYASQAYLDIGLENRKNNVVAAIKSVSPHILFLAERFEEWDGIGKNSVDLMRDLGSDYAMVENAVSYPLEMGDMAVVANRCPIIYNAKTFRLIDSGYLFLTEEVATEKSGNKRGVTWAILEERTETNGKKSRIAVFCTHWSTNTHWKTRESLIAYKQAQSNEMQALISSQKFKGLPVVVGGDFNVTYAMPEFYAVYESLLNACELTDAAFAVSETPVKVVDHIAISKHFEVLDFYFQDVENASDHQPIYCDVNYKG